jgi:hypothetical protein
MTRIRFPRLLAVLSHVRVAYEQTRHAVRSRTFCVFKRLSGAWSVAFVSGWSEPSTFHTRGQPLGLDPSARIR